MTDNQYAVGAPMDWIGQFCRQDVSAACIMLDISRFECERR